MNLMTMALAQVLFLGATQAGTVAMVKVEKAEAAGVKQLGQSEKLGP